MSLDPMTTDPVRKKINAYPAENVKCPHKIFLNYNGY